MSIKIFVRKLILFLFYYKTILLLFYISLYEIKISIILKITYINPFPNMISLFITYFVHGMWFSSRDYRHTRNIRHLLFFYLIVSIFILIIFSLKQFYNSFCSRTGSLKICEVSMWRGLFWYRWLSTDSTDSDVCMMYCIVISFTIFPIIVVILGIIEKVKVRYWELGPSISTKKWLACHRNSWHVRKFYLNV